MMSGPFAVFLVARLANGQVAAVSRPDGSLGLPGGKVDPGETWKAAVTRESLEEGWQLPAGSELTELHQQEVDGQPVMWALLTSGLPTPCTPSAKDVARGVRPVRHAASALVGFGNPEALAALAALGGQQ